MSSEKFLDGLLDMWTNLVVRQQGALVVAGMLDFLTFSLCSPYSETTDGKQFDMLLEKVSQRGRLKLISIKNITFQVSLAQYHFISQLTSVEIVKKVS